MQSIEEIRLIDILADENTTVTIDTVTNKRGVNLWININGMCRLRVQGISPQNFIKE